LKGQKFEFDWVDAFTSQAFGGNACMVVYGADELSIEARLALVRETSLSECAFIVHSDKADFGACYYLFECEIPMAGHPTIATVTSLLARGFVKLMNGSVNFTLEVGAGVLPIQITKTSKGFNVRMTQMAPTFGIKFDSVEIANIYGLRAEDIMLPPQIVSTGTPVCIILLNSKDALRRAKLCDEHLGHFLSKNKTLYPNLMEPFLVTMGGETKAGDTFSRLLMPGLGSPEDSFTGSATGCMAAFLWHYGLINTHKFIAEQGHWLGRPGSAEVEVLGPSEEIFGINVSGYGFILMRGVLSV